MIVDKFMKKLIYILSNDKYDVSKLVTSKRTKLISITNG